MHCNSQVSNEASTHSVKVEAVPYSSQRSQSFLSCVWQWQMLGSSPCLSLQEVTVYALCAYLYLQIAESSTPSTVVVKIVKISPAAAPCRSPNSQHTVSILDSSGKVKISFSAVYQPCNLLERPKVHSHCVPCSQAAVQGLFLCLC